MNGEPLSAWGQLLIRYLVQKSLLHIDEQASQGASRRTICSANAAPVHGCAENHVSVIRVDCRYPIMGKRKLI